MKRDTAKAIMTILRTEGLRHKDLAKSLGIRQAYISRWKKNTIPSLENTLKMARKYPYIKKYLGLDID